MLRSPLCVSDPSTRVDGISKTYEDLRSNPSPRVDGVTAARLDGPTLHPGLIGILARADRTYSSDPFPRVDRGLYLETHRRALFPGPIGILACSILDSSDPFPGVDRVFTLLTEIAEVGPFPRADGVSWSEAAPLGVHSRPVEPFTPG